MAYSGLAENLAKYQKKGNQIAVVGRIQTGSYDNNEGKKVYTTDIVVNEVQFLSSQKQNSTENTQSSADNSNEELEKYKQLSTKTIVNSDYNPELAINDDDLPF